VKAVRLPLAWHGGRVAVEVCAGEDEWVVGLAGRELRVRLRDLEAGSVHAAVDGVQALAFYCRDRDTLYLHVQGRTYTFTVAENTRSLPGETAEDVRAPLTGLVSRVLVEPGQRVEPGQPLYVVEAMKMETVVRAPRASRVRRVLVEAGQQVEGGAVVVELEEAE
jgi:biotin carboxyl carrier protein